MAQGPPTLDSGVALTFDDVLLVPGASEVLPTQVDTSTQITRSISLKIPVISSAMDTVTEARLAIAMAQEGGIGVIHRNLTPEEQARQVAQVKKYKSGIVLNPVTIHPDAELREALALMAEHSISGVPVVETPQNGSDKGRLVGILTNRDVRFATNLEQPVSELMTREKLITVTRSVSQEDAKRLLHSHRIEKLLVVDAQQRCIGLITVKDIEKAQKHPHASKDAEGRLRVAAATTVGDDGMLRTELLMAAGCDLIVVDTAHGHSARVLETVTRIKKLSNLVQVIAGNVATADGTKALIDAGADAVKVGIGPGSICTTRIVAGVGVPQLTAVMDCAREASQARRSHYRRRRHQVFGRHRKGAGGGSLLRDDRLAARRHRRGAGRHLFLPGPDLQGVPRHGLDRRHGARLGGPLLPAGGEGHLEAGAGRHRGSGALQGSDRSGAAPARRRPARRHGLYRRGHAGGPAVARQVHSHFAGRRAREPRAWRTDHARGSELSGVYLGIRAYLANRRRGPAMTERIGAGSR